MKRAGKDFVGRCPFHEDDTASLVVTPAKNLWHCFGSGAGGGPIDWVMKKNGVSFRHAVELLREGLPSLAAEPAAGRVKVIEAGCMPHARRKFHELWANHKSALAGEALKLFRALYDIEREALAPDIVAAILDDTLPNHITLFYLAVDPPALWDEQRERIAGSTPAAGH